MHGYVLIFNFILIKGAIVILLHPVQYTTSTKSKTSLDTSENEESARNKNSSARIVGGEVCSVEEYPWMVSLRRTYTMEHFCGGSLISKRWVLSAAHCFRKYYNNPNAVTALMGLSNEHRGTSQASVVKKICMHEHYDAKAKHKNDIALLYLHLPVLMLIGAVGFVRLPTKELSYDLSRHCPSDSFIVAGWGSQIAWIDKKPEHAEISKNLMCVNLPYINNTDCVKFDFAAFNPYVICTLYPAGGKDACQGDSGGPLFCEGVQYGIVSWGRGCAAPKSPCFYTRVDRYIDFLRTTIENYRDSSKIFQLASVLKAVLVTNTFCSFILMYD